VSTAKTGKEKKLSAQRIGRGMKMTELTFEELQKAAGGSSEEWHRVFNEMKKKYNETNIVLLYLKMSEENKELLRSLR
jgi:arsenate reductase-like glutaredoxin family protein